MGMKWWKKKRSTRGKSLKKDKKIKEYPGTELNRHSHYCEKDFKSFVSTNSTTRVNIFKNILHNKKKCRKKIPTKAGISVSERPGSNRPPRPWQGRALPNELLSHIKSEKRTFLFFVKECKNKGCILLKKIIFYL